MSSSVKKKEEEAMVIVIDSSSDHSDGDNDDNNDVNMAEVVHGVEASSAPSLTKKKETEKKQKKKTPSEKVDGTKSSNDEEKTPYEKIMGKAAEKTKDDNNDNKTTETKETDTPESKSTTPKEATPKTPSTSSTTTKKTPSKTTSSKKSTPSPFLISPSGKMTYIQMVHEAIQSLKGTSSSTIAITKFMMGKHEHLQKVAPNKFKTSLNGAIKAGVKSGRFIKVKASYKINPEWVKKEKQAIRAKQAEKKARERKRQKELEKARKLKIKKQKDEEKEKLKQQKLEEERKRKEKERKEEEERKKLAEMTKEERESLRKEKEAKAEAERRKAEAAARAKIIAERIRKRKFPMDDKALIEEDKELGVKRPENVTKTPSLPHAMMSVIPLGQRNGAKPPNWAMSSSSCLGVMTGSRGLMSDLLQVYHFFRGDVGISKIFGDVVPPFTLKHLMHAVDEVRSGNAKAAKTIPPLISHLFVTALSILTSVDEEDENDGMEDLSPQERQLNKDLSKLGSGLNSLSWSEICFYYMDLMERFYSTDASANPNVLPGDALFDISCYLGRESKITIEIDESSENDEKSSDEDDSSPLPEGYLGYLGHSRGALAKAYYKIARQDPWSLTADELLSLLRALTDDIVGTRRDLAEDISDRGDQLYDLLRTKKTTEWNYRKVKTAYEGTKQPPNGGTNDQTKGDESNDKNGDGETKTDKDTDEAAVDSKANDSGQGSKKPKSPKPVPTATKKEFQAAEKARDRAIEAYEKGLKKLISRTEPLGYDRNFNGVYFSLHDPSLLLVEVLKSPPTNMTCAQSSELMSLNPNRSWHVIETKSLFDKYLSSLDVRGIRENSLFEELSGNVRRFLFDDIKEKATLQAQKREYEQLERRLENAKIACAAEEECGRRSGRLASLAQDELRKVEEELKFAKAIAASRMAPADIDYYELTGLKLLSEFDSDNTEDRGVRRICSQHWPRKNNEPGGIVSVLVSEMLSLEKRCNGLAPWDRKDIKRTAWLSDLKGLAMTWSNTITLQLGLPSPEEVKRNAEQNGTSNEDFDDACEKDLFSPLSGRKFKRKFQKGSDWVTNGSKKQKQDDKMTTPQIVSLLKRPLLDLEARVFTITGLEMAAVDTDVAGEDVSEEENDKPKERQTLQFEWKKKIHKLRSVATKRSALIRDTIISALASARKAHQHEVVVDLRSALQKHQPGAPAAAKKAALEVLEKNGGYTGPDDDDCSDSEKEDKMKISHEEESSPQSIESLLCGEAMMMTGSLQGDDYADRVDWKDAVKGSRTISRLAAVAESFITRANDGLLKVEAERDTLLDAIEYWEDKYAGSRKKSGKTRKQRKQKEKYTSASEIWADAETTDQLVMGKVDGYPWWPAKVCEAKDTAIDASLKSMNKVLISFVGEAHLHVVNSDEDIRPFTLEVCEKDEKQKGLDKATKENLQESIILAKQIFRKQKSSKRSGRSSSRLFFEEKKSAN